VQRRYEVNLADEDWSFLRDPAKRADFWDPLKYISLSKPGWYVTLGGEARLSPQGLRVRGDEKTPSTIDNYFLQRYLLAADFHLGPRFRIFTEMQSGIINGRINSPRPNDKDLLEFHQCFFAYRSVESRARRLSVRIGRQELNIGSGRLISPSQGLNVKRSFDGLTVRFTSKQWAVEGGAARLVRIRPGVFDDPPDTALEFWGVSAARRNLVLAGSQLSLYYLGISQQLAIYAQGIGPEQRHTFGARWSGKRRRLDYNYDVIGQWGQFRGASIGAWAVSTDTGYSLKLWRFPARAGVTANSASGDRDPADPQLGSFNPLFPGNSYSGLVGLLGPTNLTDFTPSLKVPLRRDLIVAFEMPFYFRTSARDGVYSIDQRLLLRGQSNTARRVGANPGVIVSWQVGRHVTLLGAITRFQSGGFLQDTFLRNGFGFYSIAGTYRF
jgi:hypothetical protein